MPSPSAPFNSSSPTLPSITHSLLQTSLSLKRDFRFLKLVTVRVSDSNRSSLEIAFNESETVKLLRTSLARLNSATRCFIRDANVLLDEEVNRSFDAYLRRSGSYSTYQEQEEGREKEEEEGQEGEEEGQEGEEEEWHVLDMTPAEKETRRELRRVFGVVEELRGVFLKKTGKYVLRRAGGKVVFEEKGDDGEVGDLGDLVGVLGKLNEDGDEEDDKGKDGKVSGDEDIKVGLERLACRLGMGKREERRAHRL